MEHNLSFAPFVGFVCFLLLYSNKNHSTVFHSRGGKGRTGHSARVLLALH